MQKNIKIYENKMLAERIRTLMGKHRITLVDMAKATGCAVSTASTWRRGRMPRKQSTLEKLATLLHVSPDYLLGKSNIIFSNEIPSNPQNKKLQSEIEQIFAKILENANGQPKKLEQLKDALIKISDTI